MGRCVQPWLTPCDSSGVVPPAPIPVWYGKGSATKWPPICTPEGADKFQYAAPPDPGIACCKGLVACAELRPSDYLGYNVAGFDIVFACRELESCPAKRPTPWPPASRQVARVESPPTGKCSIPPMYGHGAATAWPPKCTAEGADKFQYELASQLGISCCEGLLTCPEPRPKDYPLYGMTGHAKVFVCRTLKCCKAHTPPNEPLILEESRAQAPGESVATQLGSFVLEAPQQATPVCLQSQFGCCEAWWDQVTGWTDGVTKINAAGSNCRTTLVEISAPESVTNLLFPAVPLNILRPDPDPGASLASPATDLRAENICGPQASVGPCRNASKEQWVPFTPVPTPTTNHQRPSFLPVF